MFTWSQHIHDVFQWRRASSGLDSHVIHFGEWQTTQNNYWLPRVNDIRLSFNDPTAFGSRARPKGSLSGTTRGLTGSWTLGERCLVFFSIVTQTRAHSKRLQYTTRLDRERRVKETFFFKIIASFLEKLLSTTLRTTNCIPNEKSKQTNNKHTNPWAIWRNERNETMAKPS